MKQPEKMGSVYFLIRGELVKVGFSTNVPARMASFQQSTDDLLAVIPNVTLRHERACHKALARWHAFGEWFHATAECVDAVSGLVESGTLDNLTDEQARFKSKAGSLVASIAAHSSWARTEDRSARTAPARAAMLAKFEAQADPDGTLPPAERARRAEHLRKAHFQRLALKSARARARRKAEVTA